MLRGLAPVVDRTVLAYEPDPQVRRDRALASVISELKLVKDEWEIAQLQDAIDATVRGFEDVARILPADRGVPERLLEGVFGLRARVDGNDVGYSSIVGAGAHATILHWVRNTGVTAPGELLLMDMGVENRNFYTADVTRTVPVSGTFTPLQRQVYDIVHASQRGRHGRHQARRQVPRRAPDLHAGAGRGPARPGSAAGQRGRGDERQVHGVPPVDAARLRPHARRGRARLLGCP
nr:hypothetical protein GCM10020092_083750 [Actinoplanes digitatis]